jgi:dolichol-phosphate mannosyltransferase
MNEKKSADTVVLLPTYNESGNLNAMLRAIHESVPAAHILVIDDNSPDGTGQMADQAAAADRESRIHVAHRPGKQGLGVAYRFGYQWALVAGYERIIQMDCDFSHNPKDLPRILELLDRHPVVVGSRRVEGGGADGWPWYRNLISNAGSIYARTVLTSPVHDLTAGFKGFRREALAKLPLDQLRTDGFGFQIEVTCCFIAMHIDVYEMPIRFVDREVGQSKMSAKIFVEAMLKVWSIRRDMRARLASLAEESSESARRPS